jgi:hypothetical protein
VLQGMGSIPRSCLGSCEWLQFPTHGVHHFEDFTHKFRPVAQGVRLRLRPVLAPSRADRVSFGGTGGTLVLATWCQREETPENPFTEKDKAALQFLYDEWAHPYFVSIEEYKRLFEVLPATSLAHFSSFTFSRHPVMGGGITLSAALCFWTLFRYC